VKDLMQPRQRLENGGQKLFSCQIIDMNYATGLARTIDWRFLGGSVSRGLRGWPAGAADGRGDEVVCQRRIKSFVVSEER
jgi:hypothetical protein